MSISIDGFVAGPNHELDWIFKTMDEHVGSWQVENISQAGAHLMGTRTYYDMVSYWPSSTEPVAAPMNAIPKIVFSKKGGVDVTRGLNPTPGLKDAMKNKPVSQTTIENIGNWAETKVIVGDLKEGIQQLKQESGKSLIAHGGASFAQSLVATGLIDEYHLLVHPAALGKGMALFAELPAPLDLQLIRSMTFPSGAIAKMYRPVK